MDIAKDHELLESMFALLVAQVDAALGQRGAQTSVDGQVQDRYFSIELCTQICSQIIEQNSAGAKRGTKSKSSSTIVEELLLRCE